VCFFVDVFVFVSRSWAIKVVLPGREEEGVRFELLCFGGCVCKICFFLSLKEDLRKSSPPAQICRVGGRNRLFFFVD